MKHLIRARDAVLICGVMAASAPAARSEVVLSVYGGSQSALHSTLKTSNLGDASVAWQGRSFEPPPYYGVRAVWWKNARWGYGLEYNHTKLYADNPQRYGYSRLEFTDGLNIITANVWRRWQSNSRITPYVGAGVGVAVPHVEITPIGGPATSAYQLTGPAVQLVAGLSYQINDRWSVFTEYKGVYSHNEGDLEGGSTFRTNAVTNAINLGVTYRF
ncbi:MAG: outer membrane protein [Cypionkella sp.]